MASFWGELKRRNVFKIGAAYAFVAWLLIQVASVVLPTFDAPRWVLQTITFVVILGFPLALVLAWAYELTPEGIKPASGISLAVRHSTGRTLAYALAAAFAVILLFLAVDRYLLPGSAATDQSFADRPSIAVLPFDNRSAREEDAFFVDGIHDDILTRLARIGSIKVISRTSVVAYRNSGKNIRTIGAELGVATILEGGVQRAGDTVRITVQLIQAATDEHVWAEIYDRTLTAENVFAVQSEMATSIAAALRATLSPDEVVRLSDVPTLNTQAYDFYLAGNDYSRRVDFRTYLPLAIQMYERAVEEDPRFGQAWAKLSIAHGQMHWFGFDRTASRLTLAEDAARRALSVAPDVPEARLAMGYHYYRGAREYDLALEEFSIAERGIPGNSELAEARAYVLRRVGRWEDSLASLERAIELDPRNANLLFQQAGTLNMLRDYAQAEAYLERSLEIAPDSVNSYVFLAQLPLRRDGDASETTALIERSPVDLGIFRQWLAWTAALYERDYARAIYVLDDWDIQVFEEQSEYLPKAAFYAVTHELAGQAQLARERFEAARAELNTALQRTPDDERVVVALAAAQVGLGEHEEGMRLARRAMALVPPERDAYAAPEYRLLAARVFARAGDHEAAIASLDEYLAAPGDWSIEGLLPDPRFDPLRDDPSFRALVERYRRRAEPD